VEGKGKKQASADADGELKDGTDPVPVGTGIEDSCVGDAASVECSSEGSSDSSLEQTLEPAQPAVAPAK
ncbi:MAG: hypothetical protein K0S15_1892, partial [Solirubrobacterales bacterium]|nr:hypothetical protein [Solirubrobacterales bacterium]